MNGFWKCAIAVTLGLSGYSAFVAWTRPPVSITVDVPNFPQGAVLEDKPLPTYRELCARLGIYPEKLSPKQRAEWEVLRKKFDDEMAASVNEEPKK